MLFVAGRIAPDAQISATSSPLQVLALIEDGIGLKQAVAEIAGAAGAGKSELYQSVLEARKALR
ncbi:MAG: hypothetical protein RIS66_1268 [Actinomycetota bacterium]